MNIASPARASRLALAIPVVALSGAYFTQYAWGLFPCEMCWWQRYAHFAALALALAALLARQRALVLLAGLAILVAGLIGAFHAGVEYGWWEGITACASVAIGNQDPLEAIMHAPLVRCDVAPWTMGGISLAGFNFIFSTAGAIAVFWLLAKKRAA